MTVEISCSNCGADAFLTREPIYEGLKKTGERLLCSACGFEYATEADVCFKEKATGPGIFTDADRSAKIEVFEEGEADRLCRRCANYVVNPFMQFCSLHKKEIQATDCCAQFEPSRKSSGPLL